MLENATICLTRARRVRLDNVGEILMMLNCFYVTFYLLRMLLVVIPTADLPIYVTIWAHVLIIAPSVVIVIFLAPMHAKVSPIPSPKNAVRLTTAVLRTVQVPPGQRAGARRRADRGGLLRAR